MNLPLRHRLVAKVVQALCLFALWFSQILPLHSQVTSWPTDWRCESLQDTSGEWWECLRIETVPGVLYHLQESNPNTERSYKCNLFLTHLANRMGATTPYFFRKSKKSWITSLLSLIPSAPLARDDWHLNPELNIDLDLPGWRYMGEDPMPEPGMSAASYGGPPISGHCGILDYDGSWISAGKDNVNKSIHLSDVDQHYKPTHFRKR